MIRRWLQRLLRRAYVKTSYTAAVRDLEPVLYLRLDGKDKP